MYRFVLQKTSKGLGNDDSQLTHACTSGLGQALSKSASRLSSNSIAHPFTFSHISLRDSSLKALQGANTQIYF